MPHFWAPETATANYILNLVLVLQASDRIVVSKINLFNFQPLASRILYESILYNNRSFVI